jgi:hypothetical protein
MSAKPLILALTLVVVIFPHSSNSVPAQPVGSFVAAESDIVDGDSFLAQNGGPTGFDLNYCQRECRARFGIDLESDIVEHFRGGGSRTGNYYAYANCIAACNAQFWKEFDRKTKDMEKLR